MTTHHGNLVQLAARQDQWGVWARGQRKLERVTDLLVGELTPPEAAACWEAWSVMLDLIAENESVGGVSPGQVHRLADRLRGVAAVIEEADLA